MIVLRLYGHPTSTYEYIKMKLMRNAREGDYDLQLEEVNDLEVFVNDGVDSIPSVRINNYLKVGFDGKEPVQKFIDKVQKIINKEVNQDVKHKILVPTDFSHSAANALKYSFDLARNIDASLDVMHAYNPTGATAEGVLYFDAELEGIRRKQLDDFCNKNYADWNEEQQYPLTVKPLFQIGYVVPVSKDIVDESKQHIIVIGSTGGSASYKKFFGSVTTEVATKVHCPVFIIPDKVAFSSPKRIAYACDSSQIDVESIQDIIDLLGGFKPELHLIHIEDDADNYPSLDVKRVVTTKYPKSKVFFHSRKSNDVVDALNKFVEEEKIDLVAVSKEKRSFLNALFHKSVTREMSIKTNVPLLVIHK